MISEHLSRIDGISIFPVISLLVFSVLFIVAIVWVFRLNKNYLTRMENLPLDINHEVNSVENKFYNNSEIKNEIEK